MVVKVTVKKVAVVVAKATVRRKKTVAAVAAVVVLTNHTLFKGLPLGGFSCCIIWRLSGVSSSYEPQAYAMPFSLALLLTLFRYVKLLRYLKGMSFLLQKTGVIGG